MNEMLQGNNSNSSAKDEEVTGNTTFVHVGGQSRHFVTPFVVHETVMTKEVSPVRAFAYTGQVETNVFPSPVAISANRPS